MGELNDDVVDWFREVFSLYKQVILYTVIIGWPLPAGYITGRWLVESPLSGPDLGMTLWMVYVVAGIVPVVRGRLTVWGDDE